MSDNQNKRPQRLTDLSADGTKINLDALYQIAPSVFTEAPDPTTGEVQHKVDFDALRALLGDSIAEPDDECYRFTWVGKNDARLQAVRPTDKTLRPIQEDSVDWDTTHNLYIEGDNLEVLKLLQRSYNGSVKMIYIDPPYNTGNDFVYHDSFARSAKDEDLAAGNIDDEGNRYRRNSDTNGRFHSDWCSMIYPRLILARNLLSDDGVIFISIDDNEVENLKKICNEVFGEDNFVDCLHWKKKKQPSFLAKHTAKVMEYVVVYAKNSNSLEKLSIENVSDSNKKIINITNKVSERTIKAGARVKRDEKESTSGIIKAGKYIGRSMEVEYKNDVYFENGLTTNEVRVVSKFSDSQENINSFVEKGLLFITKNNLLRRDVGEEAAEKRKSITDLLLSDYGDNQESDKEFLELFDKKYFDYTKPTKLIYNLTKSNFTADSLILDFFSGSATTAHAVMQLNAEDGGNRRFIMVQLPEQTAEDSEAFKAGYKNICEIGKERIRRAAAQIRKEKSKEEPNLFTNVNNGGGTEAPLDLGFRVFRVDDSNYAPVKINPDDEIQGNLWETLPKADRSNLDLLFGAMLSWGITLDKPVQTTSVQYPDNPQQSFTIYNVNEGQLVACLDRMPQTDDSAPSTDPIEVLVTAMAKIDGCTHYLLRDDGFNDDKQKINLLERFKTLKNWNDTEVLKNVRVI